MYFIKPYLDWWSWYRGNTIGRILQIPLMTASAGTSLFLKTFGCSTAIYWQKFESLNIGFSKTVELTKSFIRDFLSFRLPVWSRIGRSLTVAFTETAMVGIVKSTELDDDPFNSLQDWQWVVRLNKNLLVVQKTFRNICSF